MTDDAAKLSPADPDELRLALSLALQHDGRRRFRHGDDIVAKLVAITSSDTWRRGTSLSCGSRRDRGTQHRLGGPLIGAILNRGDIVHVVR
jgi:hypothetical protein